jgi:hypothetical protein
VAAGPGIGHRAVYGPPAGPDARGHWRPAAAPPAGGSYNVLFENSTLNGYDSLGHLSVSNTGIQNKTDANSGGLTDRVTYTDICMFAGTPVA